MHPAHQRLRHATGSCLSDRLSSLIDWMAAQDFATLVRAGLLSDVERITIQAYLDAHRGETRPKAYHWLRYEDPDPVARLAEGVKRLRSEGAKFDAEAVDKACAEASKLGYSN